MVSPLADDTSPDIEERQIRAWREMSVSQKADLISGLSQAAHELALAGVRHRYPDATPREQFLRLAIVKFGRELASRAYPDLDDVIPIDGAGGS